MSRNKANSKAVDCIACGQMIRVPVQMSANTRLRCPLCQVQFRLADVLHQDVPMAQVENIEEDDDSAVLAPMEEEVKRSTVKKREGLLNPSSPRWKLSPSKAEGNNTKGSTDGGLLSSTGREVFAEDFPFSAKAKEQSRQEEIKKKERRSRFPKKRLSKKPVSEQPFGKLKTSRTVAEQDLTEHPADSMPMIPLHQPLPVKEKHLVLNRQSAETGQKENRSTSSGMVRGPEKKTQPSALNHKKDSDERSADSHLLEKSSKRSGRRSSRSGSEPKRPAWVDLAILAACCFVSLPLAQLGMWWVVRIDPLNVAPIVRSVAPSIVPEADSLN